MSCRNVQPKLSEFIDNRLSARETWEVDLHLAECHECTRLLNEMRRTVDLLAAAPRFEVSADFMEGLQQRIGDMEPAAPRMAWMDAIRAAFRPRVLPAWGAAMAAVALVVLMLVPRSTNVIKPPVTPAQFPQAAREAARTSVALSATDPFADLGAANLTAHSTDRLPNEF